MLIMMVNFLSQDNMHGISAVFGLSCPKSAGPRREGRTSCWLRWRSTHRPSTAEQSIDCSWARNSKDVRSGPQGTEDFTDQLHADVSTPLWIQLYYKVSKIAGPSCALPFSFLPFLLQKALTRFGALLKAKDCPYFISRIPPSHNTQLHWTSNIWSYETEMCFFHFHYSVMKGFEPSYFQCLFQCRYDGKLQQVFWSRACSLPSLHQKCYGILRSWMQ